MGAERVAIECFETFWRAERIQTVAAATEDGLTQRAEPVVQRVL